MIFKQLQQQLKEKLSHLEANQGLIQINVEVAESVENLSLLAWLKAQHHFPHYYWQNRDDLVTFACVGKVREFESLATAQAFVEQSHFTLFGGLQFTDKTTFILPRLFFFAKKAQDVTACLTLDSDDLTNEIQACEQILEDLTQTATLSPIQCKIKNKYSHTSFNQWAENIHTAINAIKQAKFNKVVLANATDFELDCNISPYDLLAKSQTKNSQCYHFLLAENDNEAFIGSSPERLYQRKNQHLCTEALAGTASVTNNDTQTELRALWLLEDPKNRLENQYVVNGICINLEPFTENIHIGDAEIKRLPNVQHLRRLIEAELKAETNDHHCLTQMHPTAAIAGLPRSKAVPFIEQHEPFKRNWYAGTLGFFNQNEAEFTVTLRSALVQKNKMTIYAGAGIMEDSDPKSEWEEIERKALAMMGLLS